LLALLTGLSAENASAQGIWRNTGLLNTARCCQSATLLHDGKVLLTGDFTEGSLDSAELYDPITEKWTLTGGLNTARRGYTTTLLPDGRVLVVGGFNRDGVSLAN
jgi:hypothetical protein